MVATRPRVRLGYESLLFFGSIAIVGLSVSLTPGPEALDLFGLTLPPMCAYKLFLGLNCLGCGLTRSFTYMGHLELAAAWEMHRLGPLLWSVVAIQVPFRGARLLKMCL
jgi:hypothetical protein